MAQYMPDLVIRPEGVLLPISAQPKARKNAIIGVHDGRLKVAVTQAPEKGKANRAILKLLAAELGLKRSQLQIVSGETSNQKTVLVSDIDVEELTSRIDSACSL